MGRQLAVCGVVLAVTLGLARSLHAGPITYTFTRVADTATLAPGHTGTDTFSGFNAPTINASGQAAFVAGFADGGQGIFKGSGPASLTRIVDTTIASSLPGDLGSNSDFFGDGSAVASPVINSSGKVAFHAFFVENQGDAAIYRGDGSAAATKIIATGDSFGGGAINALSTSVSMNDLDRIAFQAARTVEDQSHALSDPLTEIDVSGGKVPGGPAINNSGRMVYEAFDPGVTPPGDPNDETNTPTSIFTREAGGTRTTIATEGDTFDGGSGTLRFSTADSFSQAINEAGTVSFYSIIDGGSSTEGIFFNSGMGPELLAGTVGEFSNFRNNTAINSSGTVAFVGFLDAGGHGLFTGPELTRVIGTGDTLLGSTVTSVSSWRNAINDSGQIAFLAHTDSGQGIYLATPVPEPSTFVIMGIGALGCLGCGWRLRQRRTSETSRATGRGR